jgi:hypothetical protein
MSNEKQKLKAKGMPNFKIEKAIGNRVWVKRPVWTYPPSSP